MVNYSTVEQRIGTWIDGKPLYQKSFTLNTGSSGSYNYYITDLSNIEIVFIDHGASVYRNIGYIGVSPYKYSNIAQSDVVAESTIDNNLVRIGWRTGSDAVNKDLYITIKYTKTTD